MKQYRYEVELTNGDSAFITCTIQDSPEEIARQRFGDYVRVIYRGVVEDE